MKCEWVTFDDQNVLKKEIRRYHLGSIFSRFWSASYKICIYVELRFVWLIFCVSKNNFWISFYFWLDFYSSNYEENEKFYSFNMSEFPKS